MTGKCINYSHVCLYFELLCMIKQPKALVINTVAFYRYIYDKVSTWERETFHITLDVWPNAIYSLPDTYKNKDKVIRSLLDAGYYEYYNLENLASKGILTPTVVDQYREQIEKYTSVNIENMYAIANGEYLHNESNKMPDYGPLLQFAKKYKKLVIYGYGKRGKRYAKYLSENGIEFEAFLATCVDTDIEVLNHQVIQADSYILTEETGIILGIKPGYQMEVYEFIKERGLVGRTFSHPSTFEDIQKFLSKLEALASSEPMNGKE